MYKNIAHALEHAKSKGIARPALHVKIGDFPTLKIKASKYPGKYYVVLDTPAHGNQDAYCGILYSDGSFKVRCSMQCEHNKVAVAVMEVVDKDVVAAATMHGALTGQCCFCRQALTDYRSVSVGYGPVCAANWGLPWGDRAPAVEAAQEARTIQAKEEEPSLEEVLDAMTTYGGSFVKALAEAWRRADNENQSRLMVAFSHYYMEYTTVAADTKRRQG